VSYSDYIGKQVDTINGEKVRNLRHAAELVAQCSKNFLIVKFCDSNKLAAFDCEVMRAAMPIILQQHKIPQWTDLEDI
jgi:hypothetical protein